MTSKHFMMQKVLKKNYFNIIENQRLGLDASFFIEKKV